MTSSLPSRLDRLIAILFMASVAIALLADAVAFMTDGTINTNLFWSNVSVVVGILCFVGVKRLER